MEKGISVMFSLGYWVHDLDPVLFQFTESIAIRWYGLAYIAGFLTAYFLLKDYYKKSLSPLTPERMENLMMAMILGVVVGGRLGYVLFYDFEHFISDPLTLFKVWEGGMASHGGFIGVILATIIFARKYELPTLRLGDLIATVVPPGLFFGRIANFVNGELWGKKSDVSWAVIFPQSAAQGTPVEWIAPRHPSQLYQASLEGLFLFVYLQFRLRKTNALKYPGRLTGEFLILYAIVRIFGELFREPDASLIIGMSRGSFYSIAFLFLGAGFFAYSMKRARKINSTNSQN